MEYLPHPPRRPWGVFPEVLIHASESAVKQHPHYPAAKAGNADSALRLVRDTINIGKIDELAQVLAGHAPTLISAHAFERDGVNAIPEVFADQLGLALGWPVDAGIVQVNVVAHTGADGFSRLVRQAAFAGPVKAGTEYVLVDDFVGMGGTLANLKGYVESNGGVVLAALALTGKPHSAKLAVTPERLDELRNKHGKEFEHWWQARFGHAFDALTESEARYLVRTPDIATIRDRIAAAEQAGDCAQGGGEQVKG